MNISRLAVSLLIKIAFLALVVWFAQRMGISFF